MADHRAGQTNVKDQGDRPTCAVFASTAGHEWLARDRPDLSEEFALWAAKQRDGIQGEATSIHAAIEGIVQEGQPLEWAWPYGYPCYPAGPPAAALDPQGRRHIRLSRKMDPSFDALWECIRIGGEAVVLGLGFVPHVWYQSHGGWIEGGGQAATVGGHAVLAVGELPPAGGRSRAVIIKNSWGVAWGSAGYGFVSEPYLHKHLWVAYAMAAL